MARPHLEFIQSQSLNWRPDPNRAGVQSKVLSQDDDTGSVTAILRYPEGWEGHVSSEDCVEEGFVLSGGLTHQDQLMPKGSYYFWPKASGVGSLSTPSGADVLTFIDRASSVTETSPRFIDTAVMDWSGNVDPNVVAGSFGKKVLREDPETGERVWLLMLGPGAPEAVSEVRIETHPHVEEVFLLDGEITMPMGTMKPGGYIWRPGGIAHGPNASVPGCLGFFRSVGGPMVTDWSDEAHKVKFDPPYAPIVPEELKLLVQQSGDLSLPY